MEKNMLFIDSIPAIIWGKQSKKLLFIFMGKTDIKKKRFCLQKLQKKKAIKQSALICQNTVSDKINLIPVIYGIVFVT